MDHPNIVKFYEDFENEKYYCLAMEYFQGETLSKRILKAYKKNQTYSEKKVADIMEKLIRAIAHCHENGVCHRDLKPENILINKEDEVKVIDFGLSKHLDKNIRSLSTRVGTPAFMAPEVVMGNNYDFKCDIWSLGVTMYNLISGQVPFCSYNLPSTLYQIINAEINFDLPIFKKISKQALDLMKNMMIKDPNERLSAS